MEILQQVLLNIAGDPSAHQFNAYLLSETTDPEEIRYHDQLLNGFFYLLTSAGELEFDCLFRLDADMSAQLAYLTTVTESKLPKRVLDRESLYKPLGSFMKPELVYEFCAKRGFPFSFFTLLEDNDTHTLNTFLFAPNRLAPSVAHQNLSRRATLRRRSLLGLFN